MNKRNYSFKKKQEVLVLDLVNAFVNCHNLKESAFFLHDLLTRREMSVLAKRLAIARLLLSGKKYEEIEAELSVSHSTVAKIAVWLSERGDGFREIIERLPKQKDVKAWKEFSEWDRIKRRYPMYFWPELVLEEIIKNASKRQKEHIRNVLNNLERKSELHKRIEKLLRKEYVTT